MRERRSLSDAYSNQQQQMHIQDAYSGKHIVLTFEKFYSHINGLILMTTVNHSLMNGSICTRAQLLSQSNALQWNFPALIVESVMRG